MTVLIMPQTHCIGDIKCATWGASNLKKMYYVFSKFIGLTYKSNHLTLKNSKCCCVQWFVFSRYSKVSVTFRFQTFGYIQWLAEFILICFLWSLGGQLHSSHIKTISILSFMVHIWTMYLLFSDILWAMCIIDASTAWKKGERSKRRKKK